MSRWLVLLALGLAPALAHAEEGTTESTRDSMLEFRLGSYKPMVDREAGLTQPVYATMFGGGAMLLFEFEYDRQLYQRLGSVAVGFSAGYGEKYARAQATGSAEVTESTSLKVAPLRVLGIYRFDYAAIHWGIPLVPYVKAALCYSPWWASKGSGVEYVNGMRGAGGKWGYAGIGGLSFLLDFLEPRLSKDFDTDMGVNHSYLFAEFEFQELNNFGRPGLDLSSRHLMFGISFEF